VSVPPPVLPTPASTASPSSATSTPLTPRPALTLTIPGGLARRPVAIVGVAIAAITLLAALAGALDPALGPAGHPHPTLHGTLREAIGIGWTNGRQLVMPLVLVAGRWPTARLTRYLGDVLVGGLLVVNPVTIGLALGRFPITLLPYLPHLPLEDAALATAVAAWLSRRLPSTRGRPPRSIRRYAIWTFTLTALGALVETFLVPHAS
jgi:hypothetical protein